MRNDTGSWLKCEQPGAQRHVVLREQVHRDDRGRTQFRLEQVLLNELDSIVDTFLTGIFSCEGDQTGVIVNAESPGSIHLGSGNHDPSISRTQINEEISGPYPCHL